MSTNAKKGGGEIWTHVASTASAIYGVKPEHSILKHSNSECYTPSSEPIRIYMIVVIWNKMAE
jgi:hypothetical protein